MNKGEKSILCGLRLTVLALDIEAAAKTTLGSLFVAF